MAPEKGSRVWCAPFMWPLHPAGTHGGLRRSHRLEVEDEDAWVLATVEGAANGVVQLR